MAEYIAECVTDYTPSTTDICGIHERIVRCRDCKMGNECDYPRGELWCVKMAEYVTPDGFCAWGERKG